MKLNFFKYDLSRKKIEFYTLSICLHIAICDLGYRDFVQAVCSPPRGKEKCWSGCRGILYIEIM